MKEGFSARLSVRLGKALTDSGVQLGGAALAYVAERVSDFVVEETEPKKPAPPAPTALASTAPAPAAPAAAWYFDPVSKTWKTKSSS